MLLQAGGPRRLGPAVGGPRVVFGPDVEANASGAPGRRLVMLDTRPAFELAYWCGSCPILFGRLEGANATLSLEELAVLLGDGVSGLDETVMKAFGRLLPAGMYVPLLLQLTPRLVLPFTSRTTARMPAMYSTRLVGSGLSSSGTHGAATWPCIWPWQRRSA